MWSRGESNPSLGKLLLPRSPRFLRAVTPLGVAGESNPYRNSLSCNHMEKMLICLYHPCLTYFIGNPPFGLISTYSFIRSNSIIGLSIAIMCLYTLSILFDRLHAPRLPEPQASSTYQYQISHQWQIGKGVATFSVRQHLTQPALTRPN